MGDENPLGSLIRIFLVDGSADGVWVVEKSNWSGKAFMAGRSRYKELRERPELAGAGVYVLIGPSETDANTTRIYVGESDSVRGRLDSHNTNKDFWTRVVVFTSKDDNLNKAHVRYLESRLIDLARDAGRAEIENATTGAAPALSEADRAEAEGFLREMLLIYPVLDVVAFQVAETSGVVEQLFASGPGANGRGSETADGFVVYEGSLARAETTESMPATGQREREALLDRGVLAPEGESFRFTRDYVFSSPSTAAMVVLGRSANGRTVWKTADGRTLKDLQTAGIETPAAE